MPDGMQNLPTKKTDGRATAPPDGRKVEINTAVGARLNIARTEAHIGISTLALDTDIAAERLIDIESGGVRPTPPELFRITKALGIRISGVFTNLG